MSDPRSFRRSLGPLETELRGVFGERLRSLVAYDTHVHFPEPEAADKEGPNREPQVRHGHQVHTLAIVESLTYDDLIRCASLRAGWVRRELATPLVLTTGELAGSLDAFPLEFADIVTHHVLIAGTNPFDGVQIAPEDVRRACEVQAKSHLLHLREGYLEAAGQPGGVAHLIAASVGPLRTLIRSIARLAGTEARSVDAMAQHMEQHAGVASSVIRRVLEIHKPDDLGPADAMRLYPAYLDAIERVVRFVDGWKL